MSNSLRPAPGDTVRGQRPAAGETPGPTRTEYVVVDRSVWAGVRGASRAVRTLYSFLPKEERVLLSETARNEPTLLAIVRLLRGRSLLARGPRPRGSRLVVILSSTVDMLLVLPLKLFRRDVVVVYPAYHFVPWRPNPEPFRLRLPKFLVQRTASALGMLAYDVMLTENSYIAKLESAWNPRMKVIVESPGVPRGSIPGEFPTLDPRSRDIDVLFLSALKEAKGVQDALVAWKTILGALPGSRLVLAGYADARDRGRVEQIISAEGLRNVEIKENISDAEKYQLLSRSKVVVVPSYMEGIPYVFYEAMAYGTLVVTYSLPTYVDIRDRVTTSPVGDVGALAQRVISLLQSYTAEWTRLSPGNFEFVGGHVFEDVVERTAKNIRSMVGDA